MFSLLYNIVIPPIELLVETVFMLMFRLLGQRSTNQGLAVIGVSVVISLLTLPLYRRADAVQQKERELQAKLSGGIKRIRKVFKGDERFMMLQAFYRENKYSPFSALKGSLSLLLEIPFFIAAYHFLSHLELLKGASFGTIADLGAPDGLFRFGTVSVNLLPVLMTLINCISSMIYLKGFPLKNKVQVYGFALVFLVLLYNSPSGLVVYWTCNNMFSLLKNIFYKLKHSRQVLAICCSAAGMIFTLWIVSSGVLNSLKKYIFAYALLVLSFIPLAVLIGKKHLTFKRKTGNKKVFPGGYSFVSLSGILLSVLVGLLIPSATIASSPMEFININDYRNPLYFLVHSSCYAAGFFLFWMGILFAMADKEIKSLSVYAIFVISIIFLADYMLFNRGTGILSAYLIFDETPCYSAISIIKNLLMICGITLGCTLLLKFQYGRNIVRPLLSVLIICTGVLSLINIRHIHTEIIKASYIQDIKNESHGRQPLLTLSKTGKNVIVLMLDRAISSFLPYMFNEKPELQKQFDGFAYYPNTLSFGGNTILASPALFGGYEYSVSEINKRDDETLKDKHNEALRVLPVLFMQNGFEVTVCDPPLSGYKLIPDLSIYDDFPQIKKHILSGMYTEEVIEEYGISRSLLRKNERNFFCYSIFRSMPLFMRNFVYNGGDYYDSTVADDFGQDFLDEYGVLLHLEDLTDFTQSEHGSFLMMQNSLPHKPRKLHLPDYGLGVTEEEKAADYDSFGGGLLFHNQIQREHYYVNMASLLLLGTWFDFLKENGVYDNTRIIIAADHGYRLDLLDKMLIKDYDMAIDSYNPLLLVKDFNSTGFSVMDDFMTNADVPVLAVKDIIPRPVNPFTGKVISDEEKHAHPQLVTSSENFAPPADETTFDTSDGHWYAVHDDIFKKENWTKQD